MQYKVFLTLTPTSASLCAASFHKQDLVCSY